MASRGNFSNQFGFIAAAAGSAVGLGNIWKFPFEVTKGGGAAFVVMYLAFCFIFCYPILVAEISIGRNTKQNPLGALRTLGSKKWGIVGILGIVCGTIILSFYHVVAGWSLGYFVEIVKGNFDIGNSFGDFVKDTSPRTMPNVTFYTTIFTCLTAYIVYRGVKQGIELTSKILMPTLIIIIVVLFVYGLTLPHALSGIEFYLIPDFSKINFTVIYSALGQAFFSLSLGMGTLITYGSYLDRKVTIHKAAAYITLADVGIAFLAGLMIFPFLGFMNDGVLDNVEGGAGLIFQTLPLFFQELGTPGKVVGPVFFLLLSFAALTSAVSLLEVAVTYLIDEFKLKRRTAVLIASTFIFLLGIPSLLAHGSSSFFSEFITYGNSEKATDFMSLAEDLANDSLLPLGGCLIAFFTVYIWKKHNFYAELKRGSNLKADGFVIKYIMFSLKYICIPILSIIFILTILDHFLGIQLI